MKMMEALTATAEPSGLSATADGRPPAALPWRVVHTLPRQEKALSETLAARGLDHYLPLVRRVRYFGRRKSIASLPLFPGYVFLRGDAEAGYLAERSGRVVRVIPVADQAPLESDLVRIRFALERSAGLEPSAYPQIGVEVEVSGGPFRGLRGVVERGSPEDRLVLGVRLLGRAAELEIDRSLLCPID
jgi:transcription antitermination factor NusG